MQEKETCPELSLFASEDELLNMSRAAPRVNTQRLLLLWVYLWNSIKTWHVTKIKMIYLAFLLLLWRNRQSEFFWSDSAEPRISVDHKQWPTLLIPLTFTFTIRHKLRHGFNGEFYWYKNICWDTIIIAIVVSAFTPTKHDILLVAQKAMIYGPHDRWRNVICPLWIDFITIHQVPPSCRSVALNHHQV